jgi:hypothetical protein
MYAGSGHVHCYAYLAHPRFQSFPLTSTIFDAAIPTTRFGPDHCFFTCSFRTHHYSDVLVYGPGMYLIEAKARTVRIFALDAH